MERLKFYPSSHSRNKHGYDVFQIVPSMNFWSKIAGIPSVDMVMESHKFGHRKSWKCHGMLFPRFHGNPAKMQCDYDITKLCFTHWVNN